MKRVDLLLDALATNAAECAPSEMEMAACPACFSVPPLSYKLLLSAGLHSDNRQVLGVSYLSWEPQVPRRPRCAGRGQPGCAAEQESAASACVSRLYVRTARASGLFCWAVGCQLLAG